MEAITLKLDEEMLKNIDKTLKKHNFSTRTEFIRDSIRKRLEDMSREELIHEFLATAGTGKRKNPDKSWKQVRQEAYKELIKEKGWD
jgi:metal-responsive CopG/Arc/MetJ family transcriptional regulator